MSGNRERLQNTIKKSVLLIQSNQVGKALDNNLSVFKHLQFDDSLIEKDLLIQLYNEIKICYQTFRDSENANHYQKLQAEIKKSNYPERGKLSDFIGLRGRETKTMEETIKFIDLGEKKSMKRYVDPSLRQIWKQIILGKDSVGKRSISGKFLDADVFRQNYRATIGADFSILKSYIDDKVIISQLWVMSGQLRFKDAREAYYLGTQGCTIVFDVTDRDSFNAIPQFADELTQNNKNKIIPLMIIGNKIDLRDEDKFSVSYEEGSAYARELSNWLQLEVPYYETSVVNGLGRDSVRDYYKVVNHYNDKLNKFSLDERLQMLLAQRLYKDVKTNIQRQPSVEDLLLYLNSQMDTYRDEFSHEFDEYNFYGL
ncbi:MAG: ADP-ribosylation factor-like protein [Candidatus Kariarchaeaceae archaeon]|jgi:small GTP-binding protein